MKFKVGDRICAYYGPHRFKGTIREIKSGCIVISTAPAHYLFHEKQCRKLKVRKRVLIHNNELAKLDNGFEYLCTNVYSDKNIAIKYNKEFTEFVEVKKK